MSRLILLVLIAAAVLAVLALIVGVFSSGKSDGAVAQSAPNGVQKVAYGVLIALMFGVAAGALGDG